jgi:hypothetical protein
MTNPALLRFELGCSRCSHDPAGRPETIGSGLATGRWLQRFLNLPGLR